MSDPYVRSDCRRLTIRSDLRSSIRPDSLTSGARLEFATPGGLHPVDAGASMPSDSLVWRSSFDLELLG
eukprot:13703340-Alexandrium_andersonii.AAC.1